GSRGGGGGGGWGAEEGCGGGAAEAAGLAGIKHRFAAGPAGSIPGFEPLGALGGGGPAGRPSPRTHGAPMLYTSGTSGRPKGVRRPLHGADPASPAGTGAPS